MVQIAKPDSDVSAGLWEPIGGETTLFEAVNGATDSDYIEALDGENTTCELGLGSLTDPAVSTGHILRVRLQGTGSGGPERLMIQLFEGATQRAASPNLTSRGAWDTQTYTLTAGEADSITDYTNLSIKLVSSNLGATEDMWARSAEFEVPDVSGAVDEEWAGTQGQGQQEPIREPNEIVSY